MDWTACALKIRTGTLWSIDIRVRSSGVLIHNHSHGVSRPDGKTLYIRMSVVGRSRRSRHGCIRYVRLCHDAEGFFAFVDADQILGGWRGFFCECRWAAVALSFFFDSCRSFLTAIRELTLEHHRRSNSWSKHVRLSKQKVGRTDPFGESLAVLVPRSHQELGWRRWRRNPSGDIHVQLTPPIDHTKALVRHNEIPVFCFIDGASAVQDRCRSRILNSERSEA